MFIHIQMKISFCILVLLLSCSSIFSQDLFNAKDLSKVRVEQLSDAQILGYQQQLKNSGVSEAQAEQMALQKGFPAGELAKLKQRIAELNKKTSSAGVATSATRPGRIATVNTTAVEEKSNNGLASDNYKVFGSELFGTTSLSFQPDIRIATPVNYELGPDDELQINVFGVQEAAFNLTISPEGSIYIPNVGMIKVAGQTVEAATARIKSRMTSIAYGTLRSGASKLSISLGKIRSIRVTILGAVKPGTYTVSSLSTLFNVLYLAGGPSANGSFREIELLQGDKVIRKIDLYNFLMNGTQADNVRLRENDVIRIPVYNKRVEIIGEVRRPGIFELIGSETLADLISYGSGFSDNAYRASIKVLQITNRDRKVKDIDATEFASYVPNPSDYFEVSRILNRFQNRVEIVGAVFRPGVFELTPNLTVAQLIRKADGVTEDAYTARGQIIRVKSDLSTEIIPFDIAQVLTGNSEIILKREDKIIITSLFDLEDKMNVSIQGEVRRPGAYSYVDSLTLKSLILQAGGFSEAAYPQRIEIARVLKRDSLTASDARLSEIININSQNELTLSSVDIPLKPFDVITVRRMPGFLNLRSVSVTGQVQFPGPYVLSNRLEKVSDLLKRAGGLTPEGFPEGAFLKRKNNRDINSDVESQNVERIQEQLKDSSGRITSAVSRPFDQIPLDLTTIFRTPGTAEDLVLKPGDEVYIPRNDEEISISGEILFPTQMPYNDRKNVKDYISDAGGFTDNARKNKIYVLYANGKAASTRNFLFVKSYPVIRPGAKIIVPNNNQRKGATRNTAETIGLASAIASLAGVVIAILNFTK